MRKSAIVPSLSVRQLDKDTIAALRRRAATHGVSMEEEVRRILRAAVAGEESAGEMMVRIFSRSWDGEPFEPMPRNNPVTPIQFE